MKKLLSVFTALVMTGWLVGCAPEEAPAPAPAPAPAESGGSMTVAPGAEGAAGATPEAGSTPAESGSGSTTETP